MRGHYSVAVNMIRLYNCMSDTRVPLAAALQGAELVSMRLKKRNY